MSSLEKRGKKDNKKRTRKYSNSSDKVDKKKDCNDQKTHKENFKDSDDLSKILPGIPPGMTLS